MGRNKAGLNLAELERMAAKWEDAGGKLKDLAENCLKAAQKAVTPAIKEDMKKHRRTGKTESSIVEKSEVNWEGTRAEIDIGFKISKGGLPSIFLMYGTPRMKKDTRLYGDVIGTRAKKKIQQAQQEAFQKESKKLWEE